MELMHKIIEDLWHLRRDIVSDGYDLALEYIAGMIPLEIHKYPSGTKCWTWTVPEKWSVGEAFIHDGIKKLLDLRDNPLHVLSYSLPVNKTVGHAELMRHLHTRPDLPGAVPYEFKYYDRDWGFCVEHNKLKNFKRSRYKVLIDSKFEKGSLKVGECTIKGKSSERIVIAAHLCHPAMVNDDLTGVSVLVEQARRLLRRKNRYTYTFLIVPETIGSIAYLSRNEKIIPSLKCGIYLEMLGNRNSLALQHSYPGDSLIDRISRYVLCKNGVRFREGEFRAIVRNDEMVFNGPGVGMPMISLSRYPYPEYHTSFDNPKIVFKDKLAQALEVCGGIIDLLEKDFVPKRRFKGPIFLSGYGLWVDWRRDRQLKGNIEKIMLNLEGALSVFEIAQKLCLDFDLVYDFIIKLKEKGLVGVSGKS